jgi:hypothetical protein
VDDDIDLPTISYPRTISEIIQAYTSGNLSIVTVTPGQGADLDTPLDAWEQRDPRAEDQGRAADLVDHLNDNLEYYHHAIWWTMDPSRRFMLFDGFTTPDGRRSVASVVENRLIGIVGNSLVMPVARGVNLDPRFAPRDAGTVVDLFPNYRPATPVPPSRVSLPTRGVFAEAIMGDCNACERRDDSRLWRWEDAPLDEVPSIQPLSTESRRAEPPSTAPTPFPTPVVSIQNAPAAPDPAGVRVAADLLGSQSFTDITGLGGTQANAAMAYQQALQTAGTFGKEAAKLAAQAAALRSIDKSMGAIDNAEASGKISAEEARSLRLSALRRMVGDGGQTSTSEVEEHVGTVDRAATRGSIDAEDARNLNRTALQDYVTGDGGQRDELPIQFTGASADVRTAVAEFAWGLVKQEITTLLKTADITIAAPKPGSQGLLRHYTDPSEYLSLWDEAMLISLDDVGGGVVSDGLSGEIEVLWKTARLSDNAVRKEEKWLGDVLTKISCLQDIQFIVKPNTWKAGKAVSEGTVTFDLWQETDTIQTKLQQAHDLSQRTGKVVPVLVGTPKVMVIVTMDIKPGLTGNAVRGTWRIPLEQTLSPHRFLTVIGDTVLERGRPLAWSPGQVIQL